MSGFVVCFVLFFKASLEIKGSLLLAGNLTPTSMELPFSHGSRGSKESRRFLIVAL